MNIKQTVKKWAEAPLIRQYENKVNTKRGTYMEWLASLHGTGLADGQEIERYFTDHSEALILYGDEDVSCADGTYASPWFKPDWSPELLETCFYLGSMIAVRRTFLEEALPDWEKRIGRYCREEQDVHAENPSRRGTVLFCNEDPEESYQALILELCRKAGGWEKGCRAIAHLPAVIHHCQRAGELPVWWREEKKTSEERLKTLGNLSKERSDQPGLSVIIPSKDNPALLEKCLQALERALPKEWKQGREQDGERGCEVIVVDNGSSEENRKKIQKLRGIQYLYEPMDFDFARMCNLGAKAARGSFLLFLNDDVELLPESHLEEMMALADRQGVGSVGLKLFYPNSMKIQHVGITNLPMGPVHKLQFLEDEKTYYFGRNRGLQNVLAVTAACVMLRAERFWEAGGFDETLKVAFNDVALGFRLYELGYRNVCMCDAYAYHHESLTRGSDAGQDKLERMLGERDRLFTLFPELAGKDPYYSPHLGRQGLDVQVRPAYVTMRNRLQKANVRKWQDRSAFREDPCLRVVIEDERKGELTGYIVVLGDDNACYDRSLILQGEEGILYEMAMEGQYRPDLMENLPDQRHVALCGFWMQLESGALPRGRYRIGAIANRKVGNMRLLNWTNRFMRVGEETIFSNGRRYFHNIP